MNIPEEISKVKATESRIVGDFNQEFGKARAWTKLHKAIAIGLGIFVAVIAVVILVKHA